MKEEIELAVVYSIQCTSHCKTSLLVKYNNVLKILSLPKNLKKSWDPRRLDNQEKKWKLEESDKKERKRLEELKEERQEERAIEEMRRRGEDAGVIE